MQPSIGDDALLNLPRIQPPEINMSISFKNIKKLSNIASFISITSAAYFLIWPPEELLTALSEYGQPKFAAIIIPFFIIIVGEVFSRNLAQKEIEADMTELISGSPMRIKNQPTMKFHGTAEDVSNILPSRIKNAISVQNTFVEIYEDTSLDVKTNAPIIRSYKQWLKNSSNGSWEDIVGIPEYFSKRYASIPMSQNYNGNHVIHVLRHSYPIINFLILNYGPDSSNASATASKEVFFGWLPQNTKNNSPIFSSTDTDLVTMYEDYFRMLKKKTWNARLPESSNDRTGFNIDYSKKWPARLSGKNIGLIDKEGIWITLSFDGCTMPNFDEANINRIGILRFKVVSGSIAIDAKIYQVEKIDNKRIFTDEETDVKHLEIAHETNNLYFGYKLKDSEKTAICHYQFQHIEGEIDFIRGVYTDRVNVERNVLIGVRVKKLENQDKIFEEFEYHNFSESDLTTYTNDAIKLITKSKKFSSFVNGPTFEN